MKFIYKIGSALSLLLLVVFSSKAQTPTFYNANNSTVGTQIPFNNDTNNKCQWIFGPNLFHTNGSTGSGVGAGSSITKIYIKRTVANDFNMQTYPNFSISLSQNVGTNAVTSATFTTGMTQVYSSASFGFSNATPGWYAFTLTSPFAYNPNLSLVLEIQSSLTFTVVTSVANALAHTVNSTNQNVKGFHNLSSGTASAGIIDFGFDTLSSPCTPTTHTITASACTSYTLNSQTYTSTGTYTQHLTNAAGCDSAITLNLTIKQPTSSTQTVTACRSYTLNTQTYTASGTYTQHKTNAAGCDSAITLNLTIPVINKTTTLSHDTIKAVANSAATYQWYNCTTHTLISGATAQYYKPTVTGNYAVIIKVGNCIDTSACTNVKTGINEINGSKIYKMYPNPSNGLIHLDLLEEAHVEITNMMGAEILKTDLTIGNKIIDIQNEAIGFYILKISNKDQQFVSKIYKSE